MFTRGILGDRAGVGEAPSLSDGGGVEVSLKLAAAVSLPEGERARGPRVWDLAGKSRDSHFHMYSQTIFPLGETT